MVEPTGFEPVTFPVLPGRAHQLLNEPAILLLLDLTLAPHCLRSRGIFFGIHERPRSPILQCQRVARIVVSDSFCEILRLSDVVATGGLALKNVHEERHREDWWSRRGSN